MRAQRLDTRASDVLYARAVGLMPGGVNSPVRAMRSIGRDHPLFVERGEGFELIDVDGNRYVDWVCSWGPADPRSRASGVVEAVREAASRGTTFGAPTEAESELAAEVIDRFRSVDMVRMVSSGTEASMSAVRLARAATGRDVVLKFAGAYHGHVDGLLADAGSGLATGGIPASPGVTGAGGRHRRRPVERPRCGRRGARERTTSRRSWPSPSPANMGRRPARRRVPRVPARAGRRGGALLVLDEVITGFRVARGGAQELFGVDADLTLMGKMLGGGLPAAAYGGRRDLMERVAPSGDVYQAGTLAGNPLAMAAGLATLDELDADGLPAARRPHRPPRGRPARRRR